MPGLTGNFGLGDDQLLDGGIIVSQRICMSQQSNPLKMTTSLSVYCSHHGHGGNGLALRQIGAANTIERDRNLLVSPAMQLTAKFTLSRLSSQLAKRSIQPQLSVHIYATAARMLLSLLGL